MNFRPILIIPPIALGILGFIWMTQPQDTVSEPREQAKLAVRAMTVAAKPLTLTAEGFGRVEPAQSWNAVSQAEGRVIETLPDFAIGTVADAGEVLIRIDPTDYEIAIAKSEANIAAAEATLVELAQQEENTRRLLQVEQRIFEVSQVEFNRVKRLSESGTATTATFDTAQRTLLNQENAVVNLTNTLALYPTQRASAEAALAVRQAELAEAERGLQNTTITAPFRGRISSLSVDAGQFVRLGNEMLTLYALNSAEVVGAFQPQAFGNLMRAAVGPQLRDVTEIDTTRVVDYMAQGGISVFVERDFAGTRIRYPAVPSRFQGSVDTETGTIGIAVRVDDPLVANGPQRAPPLEFGSFVSVILQATPDLATISIPRATLQLDDAGQPFVYTASADDTLALTSVVPGPIAGDRIMISDGLDDGDRVLLSVPRPAVPGISLDVIDASETLQ
jgi:multidrug efflux pump subunit AcrA (membrane-fusion protein)